MIEGADAHYAVEMHADREGRREYKERRHDVEVCGENEIWAWPLGDADEPYIKRVGLDVICNDIGIKVEQWQTWGIVWLVSFRKGYEIAHDQWQKGQVSE